MILSFITSNNVLYVGSVFLNTGIGYVVSASYPQTTTVNVGECAKKCIAKFDCNMVSKIVSKVTAFRVCRGESVDVCSDY